MSVPLRSTPSLVPIVLAVLAGCGPSAGSRVPEATPDDARPSPPRVGSDPTGDGASDPPDDDAGDPDDTSADTLPERSPLAGVTLYVDPSSNAARQADDWRNSRPDDAALMDRIARHPAARWLGEWSGDVAQAVDDAVTAAEEADAVVSFVVYGVPQRDCGSHSAGGADDADAYRAWIDGIAAGLAGRAAVFVLEPDALALIDCLDAEGWASRLDLLGYAIDTIGASGGLVYVDAGHAAWVDSTEMATRLLDAGVDRASGFALNVSNFRTTEDSAAYGDAIHALTDARFVVDTSRNGLGPDGEVWCNPPGRALGMPPTTAPNLANADALLWIKAPGESDGTCNGGPGAGTWWSDYALGLAERAAWE
jgi:endoglucanase